MTPANLLAYAAQVTIIVLACAGLPRLLRLRSPVVQYAFWRTTLVVCLLLPFAQPWNTHVMVFVPAPVQSAVVSPAPPDSRPPAGPDAVSAFDPAAAAGVVVLVGIVARLAWIGAGMIRLRRMRRRATDVAFGFDDLQQAIGTAAPILWSAEVRHPVTFGLFDPVVLLPIALKAAASPAQRAVIAHELHHVKRRDWGWVVGEEMVRSIFWFHPAVWWLVSRVQLARETVVDELSILATNARHTYLDTLLAFADDTGLASSPAFSARRHLFHRVMLLSQEGEMSSVRVALGSCVLILALGAGAVEAVKAFPLYGEWQQPAPPRDPLSADQHHRAGVLAWEKSQDTSLPVEERRSAILKGIAAEDRALAINPDHFQALLYKNILLRMQALLADDPRDVNDLLKQADAVRDRALNLQAAAALRPSPLPPPPPPSPEYQALLDQLKPLRIGGGVKTPLKIRDVKPSYPPIAHDAGVQGVVVLEILVDASGRVAEAHVLRSIPLLDQAALDSVKQWEFAPTLLNGVPTAISTTVMVNFTLKQE